MSKLNNFKELEKEQEEAYQVNTDRVQKGVTNNIASFGLIVNFAELYFTRLFEVIVDLTNTASPNSSEEDKNTKAYL